MVKNQNTLAKRKREMEKKAKAEAKRLRRIQRKQAAEETRTNPPDETSLEDNPDVQSVGDGA